MKVIVEWDFSKEELIAIANHLGEATVDEGHVRDFVQNAVRDAVDHAIVEHEAAVNDPSANIGP